MNPIITPPTGLGVTGLTGPLPPELVGLMTFDQFNFTMGLTGMICGLMIWLIWSQSL